MSETEKPSQKQEVNIVEKFREILDRKPQKKTWLGEKGEIQESEEDTILALYEEGGSPRSVSLEQEKKTFKAGIYLGMSHIKFGRFSELSYQPVEKTTAEQLRVIVEEKGAPTRILYIRSERNDNEGEDKSFYGIFSFSEIKKDLGLE